MIIVQAFLESITNGRKPQTRKIRFAHLTSFFNFVHNNLSPGFQNPCNSPMMRKLFRPKITTNWSIIEKDAVDEIIFRSAKIRNRLILELMARGGMRIGEVLKLTASDLPRPKADVKGTRAAESTRLCSFHRRLPTGCGNMPPSAARPAGIEFFRFPMRQPG